MKSFLFMIWIGAVVQINICRAQDKLVLSVPGQIPAIQQSKKMDCWAAVTAMMASWKDGKTYSVEQFVNQLGVPWTYKYEIDSGLMAVDQEAFVKAVGLKEEPPANYTIKAYIEMIERFGPVWITTGDGLSSHARVLIGLRGTGDYGSTQFIFIDPANGKRAEQESLVFLKKFEEEARVANLEGWKNFRIQIYHY